MSPPTDPRREAAADRTTVAQPARRPHSPPPEAAPGTGDLNLSFLAPAEKPGELGRLAQYRILGVLGQGGMGIVFRAVDADLERPVALKVIRPEQANQPTAAPRFLREARALAAIRSDHVVAVYQVGEDRGVPFLAMELLEGESLEDRLRRQGKVSLAEAVQIGRETALGLAGVHEQGLIHRDLKPGNIWVELLRGTRQRPKARIKLLDFGLARATEEDLRLTQTGVLMGSAGYLSPEQARSGPLDARSDLFSLGCILYRMCAGRQPFRGETFTAYIAALALDEPTPLTQSAPDVPGPLGALIHELLAKAPADRPESAAVVVERLRSIQQKGTLAVLAATAATVRSKAPPPEEPSVREEPTSATERVPRKRRRRSRRTARRWLWAAGVLVGVLIVGLLAFRLLHRPGGPGSETPESPGQTAAHQPTPPGFAPDGTVAILRLVPPQRPRP